MGLGVAPLFPKQVEPLNLEGRSGKGSQVKELRLVSNFLVEILQLQSPKARHWILELKLRSRQWSGQDEGGRMQNHTRLQLKSVSFYNNTNVWF